ncbi:conserved hypothetical protein [Hyella patelloides LEGE 07179]|uniref:Iron-containing redox enzyme family protein n=1 Tax=Hyella patelloides LEGE 07179 TaxID=945734 RepID=A0A563VLP7_9CYAN|nr:hypothetical protein [Hyella patelloides]VEP12342.1 conserved hypothetical protein [Hyella patelloides LEGE 07179]
MKDILLLIEEKQRVYSQSPLFEFMQDESIYPAKRLAFAPCAAPFIMSFADLCKYVLRQEPTNDAIQAILNQHTYEDDSHWQWFLEDIEKLGFNCSLPLNDSLRFVWGEETKASRLLTYQLYTYIAQSEPIEKLVVLEAMEAASDIFMSFTKPITNQLQSITNQEYSYFGDRHFEAENNHNAHSHDVNKFIESIYISEKTRQKSVYLVDQVFELFTKWNHRLLTYAQDYQVLLPLNQQFEKEQMLEVA